MNAERQRAGMILAVVAILLLALTARAHDPGLSALALRLKGDALIADLSMSPVDVRRLAPSPSELKQLASGALELKWNGQLARPITSQIETDETRGVHFRLVYRRGNANVLNVRSLLIPKLGRGHREYLSLRGDDGSLLAERMLDAGQIDFERKFEAVRVANGVEKSASFVKFLALGIEHILTGYDHICFLIGLLIAGGKLREVLKIITAFTVAHSLTLALATLNLIRLPSSVIEPMIAVSIVYVGVENLLRKNLKNRWQLSFGFGLIHGCGFAAALRDLHIGANGGGIVLPLFSFNLGVEIGQLAIAALVLPLVWKWKREPAFALRYAPACSVMVSLAGAWWLVQRVFGL